MIVTKLLLFWILIIISYLLGSEHLYIIYFTFPTPIPQTWGQKTWYIVYFIWYSGKTKIEGGNAKNIRVCVSWQTCRRNTHNTTVIVVCSGHWGWFPNKHTILGATHSNWLSLPTVWFYANLQGQAKQGQLNSKRGFLEMKTFSALRQKTRSL
jgi:hypothetical protein